MSFNIVVSETACNALNELSKNIQGKIKNGLEVLKENPWRRRPNADIKKLKSTNKYWRIRIGDYRAVYSIDNGEKVVKIQKITHSNMKEKVYRQVGQKE
jgi:mRNA interferase RelE/StbE